MTLTKKERAEFDAAALLKDKMLAALRWTSPVERDVLPPSLSNFRTTDSEGWDFRIIDKSVNLCWSSSISHGYCAAKDIGSNGARSLFSTKAKALAAMRHEIERMAAANLLKVDKMIAGVEASEQVANSGSKS